MGHKIKSCDQGRLLNFDTIDWWTSTPGVGELETQIGLPTVRQGIFETVALCSKSEASERRTADELLRKLESLWTF